MSDLHLDQSVLHNLREIMLDAFPVLLTTYLNDSEQRLQTLRQACHNGQPEALRRAAHSLKGSSSNMGAVRLAHLCHQLEERAKVGSLDNATALVERIEAEFSMVRHLLLDTPA